MAYWVICHCNSSGDYRGGEEGKLPALSVLVAATFLLWHYIGFPRLWGFILASGFSFPSSQELQGQTPWNPAGKPWTRWLKKFEFMSMLSCQKCQLGLSCASSLDLFGLYLITASFLGILNTQNKPWDMLFGQIWHSLFPITKSIYSCLIFTLDCRHVCWNYLWVLANVKCVHFYVPSFTLSSQPLFQLFMKTSVKTSELLA